MTSPDIVIAQSDPAMSRELANDLRAHFARVSVAASVLELRTLLLRHQARVAVLDLELIPIEVVRALAHDFGDVNIVCTHRSPDEQGWMLALNAGAVEFCHPHDLRSILRATRTAPADRHVARAA